MSTPGKWAEGSELLGRKGGAKIDGPWVFMIEEFVNNCKMEQILEGALYGKGFQRSTNQAGPWGGLGRWSSSCPP
jgi:hypothetical protein